MNTAFDQPGDAMEPGWWSDRSKNIHAVGMTGMVEFVPDQNEYTGVFQGAKWGLIRLSSAGRPDIEQGFPLVPGFGLKFLRDKVDSANLVAMYSLKGQPNEWNFFQHDFSNHIEAPTGLLKTVALKFS